MTDSESSLPRLSLTCLGPPAVRIDGAVPDGSVIWRKNLALLIYLALADRMTSSRGHLVGLLWPDKPEEKARHSLNEAIRRLRGSLGATRLISVGEQLTLADENLEVDALLFDNTVGQTPENAVDIPMGEFLEGLHIDDAAPFEQWVAVQRERFNALWSTALVRAGESALADGKGSDCDSLARKALGVQPFCEPAVRLLIRNAAMAGDVSGAQAVYRDFARRVSDELGGAPSQELEQLVERIRHQRWRAVRGSNQAGDEPRLAGRPHAYRIAFEAIAAVPVGARCLVVSGAPGMGKTRLIDECLDRAGLDGALTSVARPLESDQDTAWSTLRSIFRSGLADAPGMAGAPPQALSTLSAIVPDLAQRFDPAVPQDRGEIVQAFVAFVSAICDEQPVVLAIDDAHLADRSTLGVLDAALPQVRELPLGFLLAVGTAASVPPELLRLESEVGRAVAGVAIDLAPLDEAAMRAMVEDIAPWCKSPADADRLTRRLLFEVDGNPQLAVTILRALGEHALLENAPAWPRPRATIETPFPFTIPALLRSAVLARVECLDSGARAVLEAASAGYVTVDPDLIATLLETSVDDVERQLETLERLDFVRYRDDRYVFTAPLLKKAIDEACLTEGQRRRWARKSVNYLQGRDDPASVLLRVELLSPAGENEAAFDEAMSVARTAMAGGAYAMARRALAAAEHAAGEEEDRKKLVSEARTALSVKPLPEHAQQ